MRHNDPSLDSLRHHPGDRDGNFSPNRDGHGDRFILNDLSRHLAILSDLLCANPLPWHLNLDGHIDGLLDLPVLHDSSRAMLSLVVSDRDLVSELLVAPLLAILNLLDQLRDWRTAGGLMAVARDRRDTLALLRHGNLNSHGDRSQNRPHADSILNTLNGYGDRLNDVPVNGLRVDLCLRLQSCFGRHDGLGPLDAGHTRNRLHHRDRPRPILILDFLFDDGPLLVRRPGNHDLLANDASRLSGYMRNDHLVLGCGRSDGDRRFAFRLARTCPRHDIRARCEIHRFVRPIGTSDG